MGQILDCCPPREEAPTAVEEARFDAKAKSPSITLSEDARTVSGMGTAIVNAGLHQDQCYYEFKIKTLPSDGATFSIGLCHRIPEVVQQPEFGDLEHSWAFKASSSTETFQEGDVIGCVFDQSVGRPTLKLLKNNCELPPGSEIKGFKGIVHPAVYIIGGCEIEANFSLEDSDFSFPPPPGYHGLIPSRSLV